ncbi:hypothetical protein CHELA20_50480 [Hyphomicrobiales bacterium]|nr:hypothetical protein CHELA20_50480 [Hyphomicrobiales bacterium]CAH1679211.1 hypothetical protein CHELA41_24647 [Hyphomicrobiales bacterium]
MLQYRSCQRAIDAFSDRSDVLNKIMVLSVAIYPYLGDLIDDIYIYYFSCIDYVSIIQ